MQVLIMRGPKGGEGLSVFWAWESGNKEIGRAQRERARNFYWSQVELLDFRSFFPPGTRGVPGEGERSERNFREPPFHENERARASASCSESKTFSQVQLELLNFRFLFPPENFQVEGGSSTVL